MFKIKNKKLVFFLAVGALILAALLSLPLARLVFLDPLKYPLGFLSLIRREAGALIFFHHNYVQSELLRKETDFLKARLIEREEAVKENARLKELLSLKQKSPYKMVASRVIARSPDSWSSHIIIDKGRSSGVRRGMAVVNYLGLVGRVIETTQFTSKVLLVTDPDLGVSGLDQRSRQEGLVSGTLGANLIMRYLPQDADVKPGDAIVTSGLSSVYPKGILIGKVIETGREYSGLSLYALVKPAVSLAFIEEVLVIIQ
ncbi:MAG: rod shape-determining protein MreC [Candidatus Omnitrophica bacterium]|nr:rod shape-determining protein MreC [Candidatus Omnitrophota bacterium]